MDQWNKLASESSITKTVEALEGNGFEAVVVENSQQAKEKVLELLPKGVQVMTMSSVTLDSIGLPKVINKSGDYDALRPKLMSMDRKTQGVEMNQLAGVPQWGIGSVHAVTENGEVLVASNTGSQLGAYAFGAEHIIWVVGTQKIVKNLEAGLKRIYQYSLPLESERAKKAYGVSGSAVNKILIIKKEVQPGRITMILVKENLGF